MRYSKRLLDVVLTTMVLLPLLPVLLVIALSVRIKLGAPVLFRQPRPGYLGKTFTLFKFRTMTNERDATGSLLPDVERLTVFGKFLRNTSLDELPELLNVLKGDMSLVGPRPLLIRYLNRYTPEQAQRHKVKPGITGLAQVSGRNAISWEQKFTYDIYYVNHSSILLDIKILLKTMVKLFAQNEINADNTATMPEFLGISGEESKNE
jgi:lipopolysaccharide/colanic/teichoic acid biosynthesis glycosyltransferase